MVFPIVLHTLFCIITYSISKINGMLTQQFITLFCCKKPSETLVLSYFLSISCLLPVSEYMCFEPTIGLCLEFYKKKVPPRVVEGLWMGFPHPLYSSHCCHTFSNVRRVSHDHLNDRKSRPSLNMTILTPYR